MNSHFQSSEATWTRSGFTEEAIGLRGLRSCEPTHATPPTRNTVMAGIDQTSISRRPEYAKFGRYRARSFDARNQKATPSVARITGVTIASIMPSALSRICRSARAKGPFGSSTPSVQPPSATQIRTAASRPYRMLDLAEVDGATSAADGAGQEFGMHRSDGSAIARRAHGRERGMVDQEGGKQRKQIEDGEHKQPVGGAAIGLNASVQLACKQKEKRLADRGGRTIHRACKPEHPGQLRGESQQAAVDQDLARCCGPPRDNRQHRHPRTRVVIGTIKRQSPEMG